MRHRSTLAAFLALLWSLALAGGVAAGGWAEATLDKAVQPPTAGEPFDVGLTLYQHGITPVNSGNAVLIATGPDGRELSFAARRTGREAHWTATVTLPTAGEWKWRVALPNQLEVQPASFGTLQVVTPGISVGSPGMFAGLLALAAVALALVVLWRWPRMRRIRVPSRQAQRP
jgi:hypothetical protein